MSLRFGQSSCKYFGVVGGHWIFVSYTWSPKARNILILWTEEQNDRRSRRCRVLVHGREHSSYAVRLAAVTLARMVSWISDNGEEFLAFSWETQVWFLNIFIVFLYSELSHTFKTLIVVLGRYVKYVCHRGDRIRSGAHWQNGTNVNGQWQWL